MSSTATASITYTVADIRKVVENFAADFSMMAVSTGLRSRENVANTVSDLQRFAEDGYLLDVTLILKDAAGNKVRAASYKVSDSASGWNSDRPGNSLWPQTPGGILWVLANLSSQWWSKTSAEKDEYRQKRGLNSPWDPTTEDLSLAGLAVTSGQRYASNGYGWQRTNYNLNRMAEGNAHLFELEVSLPDAHLSAQAQRLVGFGARYERLRQDLRLLIDKDGLEKWSKQHYRRRVALLDTLIDRYPLVIFHGDVGTGKTATAESASNALARRAQKRRSALQTKHARSRRRKSGRNERPDKSKAFEIVSKEAGKAKLSFLIIDEADSLAARRNGGQSHHEDKVAVNTLIQKIDDVRRLAGRVLVILTNRYESLDPAILRRAAYVEEFCRPSDAERLELLRLDCNGLDLTDSTLNEVVELTGPAGPHKLGYTFSDLRTRLLPEALAQAYPSRKIERADLITAVTRVPPTPAMGRSEKG